MASQAQAWAVLKFGGTSVSTLKNWQTIVTEVGARVAAGFSPVVVCSALSGISDMLEALVSDAARGAPTSVLEPIVARHKKLASELGVDCDGLLRADIEELARLALGVSLLGEATARLRARVMAHGELMSTRLGAAYLKACGIDATWVDARSCLLAEDQPDGREQRSVLSASCASDFDPDLAQRFASCGPVILTQGFIVRNAAGDTVLLGRGGSDTSAAYIAAKIGAQRCEIWTDVPGMYTANPHQIPSARLLRSLDYDEAQEIASTGAKVLHPRCIAPLRRHRIPLHIRCTPSPHLEGTVISGSAPSSEAQVKAISVKPGITLVSMDTPGMWQQSGFLAEVFGCFKRHAVSVDLVSTSEMNVTASLDVASNVLDAETLTSLMRDLEQHCRAQVIGPCAAISLVGRNIRAVLHKLGPALEVFEEQRIHLVSQAANDLNLTFVVDTEQADRLVQQLHGLLFQQRKSHAAFGPRWEEVFGDQRGSQFPEPVEWWRERSAELVALAQKETPVYVYDEASLEQAAERLRSVRAVDRILYSVKANSFPPIITRFHRLGLGFECVSPAEIGHVFELCPGIDRRQVLFTPNFAPRHEYEHAFERGVLVTLDNLYPLQAWPEVFRGREVLLRLDPGEPRGHHEYVLTAGTRSKFGIPLAQLDELMPLLKALGVRVTGLHAHRGSGIRSHDAWVRSGLVLASAADRFPDVGVLDLGGGFGVPEKPGQVPLDLQALDASLREVKQVYPRLSLWVEPGRYLVAEAGVLLARVTQTKIKAEVTYVGVDVGMNTLIRPALYGAYHRVVNLSRLDEPPTMVADIVGPICETGDTLAHARQIAPAREGDVLLIATAGAYGRVMSSWYNMREPAREILLPV